MKSSVTLESENGDVTKRYISHDDPVDMFWAFRDHFGPDRFNAYHLLRMLVLQYEVETNVEMNDPEVLEAFNAAKKWIDKK